jgi:hypothetical protein
VFSPYVGIIPMMAFDSVLYFAGGLLILFTASRVAGRTRPASPPQEVAAPEGDAA